MQWNLLPGIIISVILGLFILYQIDFNQLISALQPVQYSLLVSAVLVTILTLFIRAWRWQYLLQPVKSVRTLHLCSATAIGFMANMLLPARAGEVVRAHIISRKEEVSTLASFATIVVERVLDLLSVLLLFALLLVLTPLPREITPLIEGLRVGGYVAAAVCGILLGSLWLMASKVTQMLRLMHICLAFLPDQWLTKLTTMFLSFVLGLQALKKGRQLASIVLLSLCLWMALALSNFLILRSFSLQLPAYAACFFLVMQTLGVAVPSAPGFIGTYHAAVVAGFAIFGVSQEVALSVAIIMHAVFFFPFILVGLLFLWQENLSLRALWSVKAQGL